MVSVDARRISVEEPKRPANLTRTVAFRVSESELAIFESKVRELGIKKSEFFREIILMKSSRPIREIIKSNDQRAVILALQILSSNIQELIQRLCMSSPTSDRSQEVCDEILGLLLKISALAECRLRDDH
jgi:hypothetical protein